MKKIMHVVSSPRGAESVSIKLGNSITNQLKSAFPDSIVTIKDLNINPFPHLFEEQILAMRSPSDTHTAKQKELVKRSNEAITELLDTDIVVISLPLFNFGIPSTLKNWLDNIIRAGQTFSYTPEGPKGLVTNKKVYIAIASGAVYSEGPYEKFDFAVPYLKAILGFIGISDVTVLRAEGLAIPGIMEHALEKALENFAV